MTDGIEAGDIVVTSGQFLIDSESNIESALLRMGDTESDSDEAGMDHGEHDEEIDQ